MKMNMKMKVKHPLMGLGLGLALALLFFVTLEGTLSASSAPVAEQTVALGLISGSNNEAEVRASAVPTDGLIAYWSFDDWTARDDSGNGHDGRLEGELETVEGVEEQAFRFSGHGDPDYIVVQNSNLLSFTDDFTFSLWFNIQSDTSLDGVHAFMSKSGDRNGLGLRAHNRGPDGLWYPFVSNGRCCGGANKHIKSPTGVELNQWHMLSFTHGNGEARFYLDGVLQGSLTTSDFNLNPEMANQPIHLGIGLAAYWYPLNGMLDEVRIYNRVLSHNEIEVLYQDPVMPLLPKQVAIAPNPNDHTVPANSRVSMTYDKNMDATTVNSQTFAVHAMQTALLADSYSVNGGKIELTPNSPFTFKPGEFVQVSATTGTLSLDGYGPHSPKVWQFRAGVAGGSGVFSDSGQSLGNSISFAAPLGDVDGDGDLDAVAANNFWQANRVWLNDGTGVFSDSGQQLGAAWSEDVALGDLDGDGDLDLFVSNTNWQANEVWLNDGTGVFTDSGQRLGNSRSETVILGDVDGDGDLDAFIGNADSQANRVWLNDGRAIFTDSGQALGALHTEDLALADVDGDGDLDAYVANRGGNRVWLNDSTGRFSDSGQSLGSSTSKGMDMADLDSDGDLDVFIANMNGQANHVWLNDGTGTFTDNGQTLGDLNSRDVALGDVDADGDLDAFVANYGTNRVWLNDGTGQFSDSEQDLGTLQGLAVALGDIDADGDLDGFVGNEGTNTVWFNQNDLIEPPVITFSIPLVRGWNLVSTPVHPESTVITDVLASIDDKYTLVRTYDGCESTEQWHTYDPSAPPFANDLSTIDETQGFWIHMSVADTLVVTGTVPSTTTIPLCTDWNLTGYPSLETRNLADLPETHTLIRIYEATDQNRPWKLFDPNAPPFVNDFSEMRHSLGYWIESSEDTNWMIEN